MLRHALLLIPRIAAELCVYIMTYMDSTYCPPRLGNQGLEKKMIISSQKYLDDVVVEQKRAANDYAITISPEFEIDGQVMQVIIDGHHSLAAAQADGVNATFVVATISDDDRIGLLDKSVDDYLAANYMDSDWYDVATNRTVF